MINKFAALLLVFCCAGRISLGQTCVVTSEYVADYRNRVAENTAQYFASLGNLVDKDVSGDDKTMINRNIREQFFLNEDVLVENDIPGLATQQYKINDYLTNLSSRYGTEIVELNCTAQDISDIYYENLSRYYFIRVVAKRALVIKEKEKSNPKEQSELLDIYFSFQACKSPKIMSIQKHIGNALDGRSPVKIVSKEEAEKTIVSDKPYFLFNLKPAGCEVLVDGASILFAKDQKTQTSPGIKHITIKATNYESQIFDVVVGDTGTMIIQRELEPKQGVLKVFANDQKFNGAKVHFAGNTKNSLGTLPLTIQVPYGIHKIVVTEYCYLSKKYIVNISDSNPTSTINVSLTPASKVSGAVTGVLGALLGTQIKDPCANIY